MTPGTLPDKIIVALLEANNGIYVADRVITKIAVEVGEPDPTAVEDALQRLVRAGLVTRGGGQQRLRKVMLTSKGAEMAKNGHVSTPTEGISLEPVPIETFRRLRRGRPSRGQQVVEAFLGSGEDAARVRIQKGLGKSSVDTYLRKHPELKEQVQAKTHDGYIYLARRDRCEEATSE